MRLELPSIILAIGLSIGFGTAYAHSFPIDGAKPQDDDALSNEYPALST
jgi:hypothetical protein